MTSIHLQQNCSKFKNFPKKRTKKKKTLCEENPCISYLELSLFWNHNPSSAPANPDVDGFKIITQHNTAATLIHLPTLILQALNRVSMSGIWCLYLSKESKDSTSTVDSELQESYLQWDNNRIRYEEKETALMKMPTMINGLSFSITNWLCFCSFERPVLLTV